MIFKEMDPEEVMRILEGHTNVLAEEVRKNNEYFSRLQCLYCGGGCHPIINNEKPFEEGSILPNFIAQCNECDAQFTPYTKIEVRGPKRNPQQD